MCTLSAPLAGGGGGPETDSTFMPVFPDKNDGNTAYVLDVPAAVLDKSWTFPAPEEVT